MWGIIYKLIIFIISGVIFRLLASIGFGLATQAFVGGVVDDYLQKGMKSMNALLSPQIAAYMHLARVDSCIRKTKKKCQFLGWFCGFNDWLFSNVFYK